MEANQNQEADFNLNLNSVYQKLSISDGDFDVNNERSFLVSAIESCYEEEFRMIESKELLKKIDVLNNRFADLIRYCNKNHGYKQVHKIFIEFCDYFDLDYSDVYTKLHDKLKNLIKVGLISMIGGRQFMKLKNKLAPSNITTLFELVKQK